MREHFSLRTYDLKVKSHSRDKAFFALRNAQMISQKISGKIGADDVEAMKWHLIFKWIWAWRKFIKTQLFVKLKSSPVSTTNLKLFLRKFVISVPFRFPASHNTGSVTASTNYGKTYPFGRRVLAVWHHHQPLREQTVSCWSNWRGNRSSTWFGDVRVSLPADEPRQQGKESEREKECMESALNISFWVM